jgi:hypothetical protein
LSRSFARSRMPSAASAKEGCWCFTFILLKVRPNLGPAMWE